MSDVHWWPPRNCFCPHGADTEPNPSIRRAPAGCRHSACDPAHHGRAFSVAHGDVGRSACLIMHQNISGWNCLETLFQTVRELVSCPSHNVIISDPSDNQETESDGASFDGPTAERVEQVGSFAYAASRGCFSSAAYFGAGRWLEL